MLEDKRIIELIQQAIGAVGGEIELILDDKFKHPMQKIFNNKNSEKRYLVQCMDSYDLNSFITFYVDNPLDFHYCIYIGKQYLFIFDSLELSKGSNSWIEREPGVYVRPVVTTEHVKSLIYDHVHKEIVKNTIS